VCVAYLPANISFVFDSYLTDTRNDSFLVYSICVAAVIVAGKDSITIGAENVSAGKAIAPDDTIGPVNLSG